MASTLVPAQGGLSSFGKLVWPNDDVEVLLGLEALYDADEAAKGRLVVVPAIAMSWTYLRVRWDFSRVLRLAADFENGPGVGVRSPKELLEDEMEEAGPWEDRGEFSISSLRSTGRRLEREHRRINDRDFGPAAVRAFEKFTMRVAAKVGQPSTGKKRSLSEAAAYYRTRAPWGLLSDEFAARARREMNLPSQLSTLDAVSFFLARTAKPIKGGLFASPSLNDSFMLLAGQLEAQGLVSSGRKLALAVLGPPETGGKQNRGGQNFERLWDYVQDRGMTTNMLVPDRGRTTKPVASMSSSVRSDLDLIAAAGHAPPVKWFFDSARNPSVSRETSCVADDVVQQWFGTSDFWKLVFVLTGGDMTRFAKT